MEFRLGFKILSETNDVCQTVPVWQVSNSEMVNDHAPAGKSTQIRAVTQQSHVKVGHAMTSFERVHSTCSSREFTSSEPVLLRSVLRNVSMTL